MGVRIHGRAVVAHLVWTLSVVTVLAGCSQSDKSKSESAAAKEPTPARTATRPVGWNETPAPIRTPWRAAITTPLGEAGEQPSQDETISITTNAEPDEGGVPLTVAFEAEVDGGPPGLRFRWDFGDNSPPAFGLRAQHTYRSAGDFTAVFSATGPGVDETDEVSIQVSDEGFDVSIDAAPDLGRPPLTVQFAASLDDDLVGPFYYQWDFGDGGHDVSNPTTHVYRYAGTYTATLTVTNAQGQIGRSDVEIQVDAAADTDPQE